MRTAIFIFVLLSVASLRPLRAAASLVHVTTCGPASLPGMSCAIPETGSGNLLVIGVQFGSDTDTTIYLTGISDNAGNVYSEAGPARSVNTALGTVVTAWYAQNSVAGATSLTLTASTAAARVGVVIWEFSGVDTAAALDQTSVLNDQSSTATPVSAAVTTSAVGVVIALAEVANSVTGITPGNSFTNDSTIMANGWAHLITSAAGSNAAQWNQNSSGVYSSTTVAFKAASAKQYSACDLNKDGKVNVADVQDAIDMMLGLVPCTADIDGVDVCNSVVVTRVSNASLGEPCVTGGGTNSHSVTLTWTASVSPNVVGYNVYQSTSSNGPYTKLTATLVNGTSYVDTTVKAGVTYYYVATAVNSSNVESAYSDQAQAVIPTP